MNTDGRLEIFMKGTDGYSWHNFQLSPNGGWYGWTNVY
jgi:hypothetical protein